MRNRHFFLFVVFIIQFTIAVAYGQFQQRSLTREAAMELQTDSYFSKPLQFVDLPTASILRGGDIGASLRLYEYGGMLGRLSVGISRKMMFGISFGGLHIIGNDDILWNPTPAVHFVYRLTDESLTSPAMVLGFDSQGYGPYWKKNGTIDNSTQISPAYSYSERYSIKSRGLYFAASKGYNAFVKTGLHGGLNYSFENKDDDKDVDAFCAIDFQLSRDIAVFCEYDLAFNDSKARERNNGSGYLNAGLRWAFSQSMYLEFDGKDFLTKEESNNQINRSIKLVYHGSAL